MSIFDGHEDKTPEELANELGISDLSVVENAGKEIVDNFVSQERLKKIKEGIFGKDSNFASNDINDNSPELENLNLWTDDFVIRHLKPGMKLKARKGKKDLYKILSVDLDISLMIIEDPTGKTEEFVINDETLKQEFKIYKGDLNHGGIYNGSDNFIGLTEEEKEDEKLWFNGFLLNSLAIGLRIKDIKGNIFKIVEFNEKETIPTLIKDEKTGDIIRFETVDELMTDKLDEYSVFISDGRNINPNLTKEVILDDSQWKDKVKLSELERGMVFKYSNTGTDGTIVLGVITDIDNGYVKTKNNTDIKGNNGLRGIPTELKYTWKEFIEILNVSIYKTPPR